MARFAIRKVCAAHEAALGPTYEVRPTLLAELEAQSGPQCCDRGCPDSPVKVFVAEWPEDEGFPT